MARDLDAIIRDLMEAAVEADELSIVPGASKRQHRAFHREEATVRELLAVWDHGGRAALLAHLNDPHPAVRSSAATFLLESDPELAMLTLTAVAEETRGVRGQTSTTAYMTLKEWKAGRMRPSERLLRAD